MGSELDAWTGVLVANRGEIALRVIRAAADLGVRSVVVHSEDDADALPVRRADLAVALRDAAPWPYLDMEQVLDAAAQLGMLGRASRVRLPQRAGGLRGGMRRARSHLRRSSAGCARRAR